MHGFDPDLSPTFTGSSTEVSNATKIFSVHPSIANIVEDAKCFWSPKVAEWGRTQTALQSQTTVFPSDNGASGCWIDQPRQILYKSSIGANTNEGPRYGAPAFLLLRKRTASEPAVRQIG
jgi:hypothetical protein